VEVLRRNNMAQKIRISKLRFQPLKEGDFTVTGTITKEMVESLGGVEAVVMALAPLMAAPELQIGTAITQAPKTLAGQLESVSNAIDGMVAGVEHIKTFIDGIRQTELPIDTDEGLNKPDATDEASAEPQTEEPVEVEATSEESPAEGKSPCYAQGCVEQEDRECPSIARATECVDHMPTKPEESEF